jgi:nucleoside-diphosphate-sugar epimerase
VAVSSRPVLVLGGLGLIGSHVVNKLLKGGYSVEVWDDLRTGMEGRLEPHDRLTVKNVDASLPESWSVDLKFAACVNCTGMTLLDDKASDIVRVDTAVTTAMIQHLPASSLIMLSEASITGRSHSHDPHNEQSPAEAEDWESRSKLMCEVLLAQSGCVWASIRLPKVVYGKGQRIDTRGSIVEQVIHSAQEKTPLDVDNQGQDRFDMIGAEDVADLVASVVHRMPKSLPYPVLHACKGKHYSPGDLVELARIMGHATTINRRSDGVPKEWCYPASRPATIVYKWRPVAELEEYMGSRLEPKGA